MAEQNNNQSVWGQQEVQMVEIIHDTGEVQNTGHDIEAKVIGIVNSYKPSFDAGLQPEDRIKLYQKCLEEIDEKLEKLIPWIETFRHAIAVAEAEIHYQILNPTAAVATTSEVAVVPKDMHDVYYDPAQKKTVAKICPLPLGMTLIKPIDQIGLYQTNLEEIRGKVAKLTFRKHQLQEATKAVQVLISVLETQN